MGAILTPHLDGLQGMIIGSVDPPLHITENTPMDSEQWEGGQPWIWKRRSKLARGAALSLLLLSWSRLSGLARGTAMREEMSQGRGAAQDMTPHLHIIGCDPGGKTGIARLTVPRASIFGDDIPEIWDMDFKLFAGPEPEQVLNIARYVREVQSLDYKTGPAIVSEAWYNDPMFKSSDPEALSPARINAMLQLLYYQTHMDSGVTVQWLGDATLTFQDRSMGLRIKDEKLKAQGLYGTQKDIRAATKHALMMLSRARQNPKLAKKLWPN